MVTIVWESMGDPLMAMVGLCSWLLVLIIVFFRSRKEIGDYLEIFLIHCSLTSHNICYRMQLDFMGCYGV